MPHCYRTRNRRAKWCRDMAATYYRTRLHGFAAVARREKEDLYDLKGQALHYLVLVKETLGDAWLNNELFRFGASTLLNDVLMQLEKERTGSYQGGDYFSKD